MSLCREFVKWSAYPCRKSRITHQNWIAERPGPFCCRNRGAESLYVLRLCKVPTNGESVERHSAISRLVLWILPNSTNSTPQARKHFLVTAFCLSKRSFSQPSDLSQQFSFGRWKMNLSEAQEPFLCVPKRRQVNSAGELDDRQVGRLASFRDRLDQPR
jgi:hypothetical protein